MVDVGPRLAREERRHSLELSRPAVECRAHRPRQPDCDAGIRVARSCERERSTPVETDPPLDRRPAVLVQLHRCRQGARLEPVGEAREVPGGIGRDRPAGAAVADRRECGRDRLQRREIEGIRFVERDDGVQEQPLDVLRVRVRVRERLLRAVEMPKSAIRSTPSARRTSSMSSACSRVPKNARLGPMIRAQRAADADADAGQASASDAPVPRSSYAAIAYPGKSELQIRDVSENVCADASPGPPARSRTVPLVALTAGRLVTKRRTRPELAPA